MLSEKELNRIQKILCRPGYCDCPDAENCEKEWRLIRHIEALHEENKRLQAEVDSYKWLYIEKDKPKENGRYLCFVKELQYNTSKYMRLLWLDNKFPWIKNRETQYEVTCWTYLPSPPTPNR